MSATGRMTVTGTMEAIAEALLPLADEIPGLQIVPFMNPNPTPPSIDMYPGEPFQTGAGFGIDNQVFFTVRARVSPADTEAGQRLLLRMLEPSDPASVEAALMDTLPIVPDGVSGFREYVEDTSGNGRLIGCEWRGTSFL